MRACVEGWMIVERDKMRRMIRIKFHGIEKLHSLNEERNIINYQSHSQQSQMPFVLSPVDTQTLETFAKHKNPTNKDGTRMQFEYLFGEHQNAFGARQSLFVGRQRVARPQR